MSFTSHYCYKPDVSGKKHKDNKKLVYQADHFSSEDYKRDVSPQFSEPDEYGTTASFNSPSFQSISNRTSDSKKHIVNDKNFYSKSQNGYESIMQNHINMHLPTFRQYFPEKKDEDKVECSNKPMFNYEKSCIGKDNDNGTEVLNIRKFSSKFENQHFVYKERHNEEKTNQQKSHKELIGTRTRYLIGTIDQVIRWYKMVKNADFDLHYEVAGVLESQIKKDGQILMFIRSESGHILQGVFYTIDRELPAFKPGTTITATGNMIGSNKLQIFDATEIKNEDLISIQRLAFLSQRSLQEALCGLQ